MPRETIETFPQIEERVLRFWKDRGIFEKSLKIRSKKRPFRFYEGPPTANAGPGLHHMLTRIFKDIICRYKTMRGFNVLRKAGWDTHGLPVELQIEKELGIKHKSEIEKFGIAEFNQKAKDSVWRHKAEWEKFTERIGFWLDLKNPYITYEARYMESLWWIISRFWKKGLLEEDYKVVPYCPRCETPLSSHEVAQGYKTVRDPSLYVKFEIRNSKFETKSKVKNQKSKVREYLLVWTTTPWTLPANVAIAVNQSITYTKYKINDEYYWSATPPPFDHTADAEAVEKRAGKSLVGLSYEPIFKSKVISHGHKSNVFRVVAGDFVSAEDGTGFVHSAPAFGEEDMELSRKHKLPVVLNVSASGRFAFTKEELAAEPFFKKIQNCFVKDADKIIFDELQKRGALYRGDLAGAEHEYPFCWRCDTPLLYYSHKSWFVRMSRMRDELLANNARINWVPAHFKEGRFGEWLREVKDWAFSRERYWGTPLPIWECAKGHREVIGSIAELNRRAWQPNKFFIMRHAVADHIAGDYIAAWPEPKARTAHLTEQGRRDTERAAKVLAKKQIDMIVSSDLARMKETVAILQKRLPRAKVSFDPRLRELDCGTFNYRPTREHHRFFKNPLERFVKRLPGGENLLDAQARYFAVWRELNRKHRGKKILILGHGDPLWVFDGKLRGMLPEQILKLPYPQLGEFRELPAANFPYNNEGEIDLHRPYVDEILLECRECQGPMRRVTAVADVWFDSGAMPFAQSHLPFDCAQNQKSKIKNQNYKQLIKECLSFPADYISEAVDQTRGWFYTLLAVSTALGYRLPPFLNVICLGHILDEKGEKMSKSKGNIVNPWEMISKYGADSLRWYFFTVNPPGEPKRFSEKDLIKNYQELMVLTNVLQFFLTYAPKKVNPFDELRVDGERRRTIKSQKSTHSTSSGLMVSGAEPSKFKSNVLDAWILARLEELKRDVTKELDRYEITQAARQIAVFTDDLSRWYVRRSRRRFQRPVSQEELGEASATLANVLMELSKLLAPFLPFTADHIWRSVSKRVIGNTIESVHLTDWSTLRPKKSHPAILDKMRMVRELSALGLKMRQSSAIKVRQPLRALWVMLSKDDIRLTPDFAAILAEELNVKEVKFAAQLPVPGEGMIYDEAPRQGRPFSFVQGGPFSFVQGKRVGEGESKWQAALDIKIDPALKEEGELREFARQVQELRQSADLNPKSRIALYIDAPESVKAGLRRRSAELKKEVGAARLTFARTEKFDAEKEFKRDDGAVVWIGIKK